MNHPVFSPGDLVLEGRFRLLRPLARGGMGEVYLAEQVSLGRPVALKVLRRDLRALPGMAERFRREARLASQVDHPGVVRVLEYGEHEGASVLVMEFVEGRTLEAALTPGPLPLPAALDLLAQLAEGLGAIHAAGIVHRDLKPENVLLSPGPHGEHARLLDFGIARLVDPGADSALSQVGIVLGTPEYLSPEQATGARVDARADVYSLGLLAYRCLTGKLPFEGDSPRAWMSLHLSAAPRPLEAVVPELIRLPTLRRLVLSCLEKEPDRRPQDARMVAEALKSEALRRELVAALPSMAREPARAGQGGEPEGVPGSVGATQRYGTAAGGTEAFGATLVPEPTLVQTPKPPTRARLWTFAAAAVVLLAVGLGLVWKRSPEQRAQELLANGQAAEALALLTSEQSTETPPSTARLHAAVLHALERHAEEHAVLTSLSREQRAQGGQEALTMLTVDFAREEQNAVLRELLSLWPREELDAAFVRWSQEPPSARAWGTLRFLDRSERLGATMLAPAYARFLDSEICDVRRTAVRELARLAPQEHREALAAVARDTRRGCGREEAREALDRSRGRR